MIAKKDVIAAIESVSNDLGWPLTEAFAAVLPELFAPTLIEKPLPKADKAMLDTRDAAIKRLRDAKRIAAARKGK